MLVKLQELYSVLRELLEYRDGRDQDGRNQDSKDQDGKNQDVETGQCRRGQNRSQDRRSQDKGNQQTKEDVWRHPDSTDQGGGATPHDGSTQDTLCFVLSQTLSTIVGVASELKEVGVIVPLEIVLSLLE